jgi:hypothetical protein
VAGTASAASVCTPRLRARRVTRYGIEMRPYPAALQRYLIT